MPAVVKELERQKSQAEMEAQRLKQQLASKSVSESKMDAMQAELANLQQRVADSEHVKRQMEQEIVEMKNKSDSSFLMQDSVIGGDSFVGGTKIENQTVNEPEAIARAAVEAYRMAKNEEKD